MDFADVIITFSYVMLITMFALFYRQLNRHRLIYRKYFVAGLFAKIIGAISFVSIYTFYYEYGGDASTYFHDAVILSNVILTNPFDYIEILISSNEHVYENFPEIVNATIYRPGQSEWFTSKFASIVTFFGLGNYLASTVIFASLSYIGVWSMFVTFSKRYPKITGNLAFAILFVPSVFFWGSGISKDSIVIGFLGLLIYYADRLILRKGIGKYPSILMIALCSYIIFNTKAYVIMSLLPAIILWNIMSYREKIGNPLIRRFIIPFLIAAMTFAMAGTIQFLGSYSEKYSIDNVLSTAQGMQSWHQVQTHLQHGNIGRGSSYTLGDYDETLLGILKMAPASINVTLFRPYPTEVNSIVMALASFESMIILIASIYVFIGLGLFRIPKIINRDAFLLMALSFSLFFAFAVGFSSYNFGALVRYKIPCIPLYISALYILQHEARLMKKRKLR
ncbi:MAG: hypothetical protein HKN39_02035 [Flavobacteriales bacterium]|nr:hypothetical protein [Flavobacteriales bacterium]